MDNGKIKIDLKSFEYICNEAEVSQGIFIKDRIPYELKERFAYELVDRTMGTDDTLGVSYVQATYDLVLNYLFAKYYTNIDLEEIDSIDDFRALFDYMQINRICINDNWVKEYIGDDMAIVKSIENKYRKSIVALYETEQSLGYAVKKQMNTDPDTNNSETRDLIEKLIDMKGALLEKEEQDKVIQFGKQKSANVKTGGARLNLSKR